MRTIILILIFAGTSFFAFSQEEPLLSKKGRVILPEQGDFAIGLSANPFFDYAGNLLSSSGNNTLRARLLDNNLFMAKYFVGDKTALRLKMRLNSGTNKLNNKVAAFGVPGTTVEDVLEQKTSVIEFTPGIEFRKGNSRLQMSYGGEVIIAKERVENKFSYGNNFSATNPSPLTTIDFVNKISANTNTRQVENIPANDFKFGIRAFIGVEYFFAPKMSVGAETGLAYISEKGKEIKTVTEFWDFAINTARRTTISGESGKTSNLGTDVFNGQIFLLFHF